MLTVFSLSTFNSPLLGPDTLLNTLLPETLNMSSHNASCVFYSNNFSTQTNYGYSTKRVSAITGSSSVVLFTCMVHWPSVYIKLETELLKFVVKIGSNSKTLETGNH
jgi:hypothetical protein